MALTRKQSIAFLLVSTTALIALAWFGYWQWAHRQQHATLTFMDVGQGDAALIDVPGGRQMLIDCGRGGDVVLPALARNLSYFDRTIEDLIVTHADTDHYAGCIDVLNRYRVERLWYSGIEKPEDPVWLRFKDAIARERIEPMALTTSTVWHVGDATITSLFPLEDLRKRPDIFGARARDNNRSVIVRVQASGTTYLLTGDAEEPLETHLVERYGMGLHADVLKIGHHGSNTSSNETFLEMVGARVGVISAGRKNSYGHPHPRVLARLARLHMEVRRTDLEGDIRFVLY